jgi:Leucine-rich repeat (LRR) protein
MYKILLPLICFLSLLLGANTISKAQLVHIPDSAFRNILNIYFSSCMVGDSIDSSCPAVLAAKYIDVSSRGISNLSGIEVFVNDTLLNCSNNQLTSLPNLPLPLTYLYCLENQLTSLPNLPQSLIYINCNDNVLTSLPILPTTLTILICSNNQISSLPTFPQSLINVNCSFNLLNALPTLLPSLTTFDCSGNQITSLPTLPSSLVTFGCSANQLTSLPTLPSTLHTLSCAGNQLDSLPTLPSSLARLYCQSNQLNSLPNLPSNLFALECTGNQLTTLPPLPNGLIYLLCNNNQITTLPALPSTLNNLICNNNQLTSLPVLPDSIFTDLNCNDNQLSSLPLIPASLKYIRCERNQLTSLPALHSSIIYLYLKNNLLTLLPTLPTSLKTLNCDSNQLTSLPALPPQLESLGCRNNQLTSLPLIPSSLESLNCSNNPLICLPDLNQLIGLNFTSTQINCLPGYGMLQSSFPSFIGFPLCDVFNTNGCDVFWNIEGKTFFDADTNCIAGTNESLFKNQKLNLYKNGVLDQQTFSNVNGNYDFDTFSFDFYKIEFDTTGLPFEAYCPSSGFYLDTISVSDSMKYDRDFGLKCKDIDLATTSIFTNNLRPASIREIKIQAGDYSNNFGDHCAAGISGTVNITLTGACNYYSPGVGALTPNSIIGNVLTYNIADFGVLNYDSSFNFNILVDTTAALGSQICIQVSISTPFAELNYNNNLLSQCFTVVGSFDPNDKTAFPNSTLDISGDRWLTYLIRFQNTGTASAEHIYITDTLSASLDWSTFNLLSV